MKMNSAKMKSGISFSKKASVLIIYFLEYPSSVSPASCKTRKPLFCGKKGCNCTDMQSDYPQYFRSFCFPDFSLHPVGYVYL